MKPRVGVIGLGALGMPVAERLLKDGCSVAVFDLRAEPMAALKSAGARHAALPRKWRRRAKLSQPGLRSPRDSAGGFGAGRHPVRAEAGSDTRDRQHAGAEPVLAVAQALSEHGSNFYRRAHSGGLIAARERHAQPDAGRPARCDERATSRSARVREHHHSRG